MESFHDDRGYGISHIGWGLDPRANMASWAIDPRGVGMGPRGCYGNVMFSTGPNTELRVRGEDVWGDNDSACHLDIPMFGVHADARRRARRGRRRAGRGPRSDAADRVNRRRPRSVAAARKAIRTAARPRRFSGGWLRRLPRLRCPPNGAGVAGTFSMELEVFDGSSVEVRSALRSGDEFRARCVTVGSSTSADEPIDDVTDGAVARPRHRPDGGDVR